MAIPDRIKNAMEREGLKSINKPKLTPKHSKKKAVVMASNGEGEYKLIRFGAKGYGHNYSEKARKSYLARSAGIKGADNKLSANYWARTFLWGGSKGVKQNPPK